MSSNHWTLFALVSLASIALAASARAADQHNWVLFIPEALSAADVEPSTAPDLARLRHEGVNFANSHSAFPKLASADSRTFTSDLDTESLLAAAGTEYAVDFITDMRGSVDDEPAGLRQLRDIALPRFKGGSRPFFLIYRLAEPPNATHAPYTQDPLAANAALESIEAALKAQGLYDTTNIVVAAEHVLARVVKVSATSRARVLLPREKRLGTLVPGFVAIDLVAALQAQDASFDLFDSDHGYAYVDWDSGGYPLQGNGVIAGHFEPSHPYLTIEAHGVYDSIYVANSLSRQERKATARLVVTTLLAQDYLSGIFVNEGRVGRIPGALALSHIVGSDPGQPLPDIVVAFASSLDGCARPARCMSVVADTPLMEGEAVPNRLTRVGTWTFMAARGPDFRKGMIDRLPVSNADLTRTLAELMQLDVELEGGRVLAESFAGAAGSYSHLAQEQTVRSKPSAGEHVTQVRLQSVGGRTYFDAVGSVREERVARNDEPRWHWHLPRIKEISISNR